MKSDDYPLKEFATQKDFETWLNKEYETTPGVWLKFAKKGSGVTTINYAEALDIALCYGWIDGMSKRLDQTYYLQKFTPRGPKSIWSKINCANVERLIKEGKMQPAGLEKIKEAKADGRWERAYDSPKTMEVPADFLKELKKYKRAYAFYQTLNRTNTYAIAWRLQTAKKPETRTNRMKVILEMLKNEGKIYP